MPQGRSRDSACRPLLNNVLKYDDLHADHFLDTFASMSYAPVLGANGSSRPQTPHMSKSFSRIASSPSSPLTRSRASTLQTVSVAGNVGSDMTTSPLDENNRGKQEDIFEKSSLISSAEGTVRDVSEIESPRDVPEGFDELPIELISLIDR